MDDSPLRPAAKPRLWIGLALAVLLDAPMQLLWKFLVTRYDPTGSIGTQLRWLMAEPRFWLLLGTFAAQFFNWMWVLGQADLSYAQPVTALSYVTVSVGAVLIFHEHLSAGRCVGIAMILCGVVFVSSTKPRTGGTT